MNEIQKINVAILDDHIMFTDFLKQKLSEIANLNIKFVCNDYISFEANFRFVDCIDVVILDMYLPELKGLSVIRKIKKMANTSKIIVLSSTLDIDLIRDIYQFGASAFVSKSSALSELLDAIHTVNTNKIYYGKLSSKFLFQNNTVVDTNTLTEREIEILRLICFEKTNDDIASLLNISKNTVDTHRKNVMKKIGVNNILGLYKFAQINGII